VTNHFFDAPLAGRVTQITLSFAETAEQTQRFFNLFAERRDDIAIGHERNVFAEIWRVFS
jgi:hypothetical protein